MTPRCTACVFVLSCVLLLMHAVVGVAAVPPASEGAAATPGSIFTLAGDPLIEGMATMFGQGFSAMAVSGRTLYIAGGGTDVIHAVDMSTDEERVIAGTSAAGFGGDGGRRSPLSSMIRTAWWLTSRATCWSPIAPMGACG